MHAEAIADRAERELHAQQSVASKVGTRAPAADKLNLWTPAHADQFTLAELVDTPPPMRFVIAPYIPEGSPVVMTGAGGTSKTGTMTMMTVAIGAALDLFGESVDLGRVLIVTAEDRRAILLRHVWANTRHLSEIQRKRVCENLFVKDAVGSGFKLTRHIDGQTDTAVEVGQLIEYASEIEGLRLVVFDTLSRLNGGEESNEDLARFVEAMERVSVQTGAATLALHHSGKAQMRADSNDQYSGRGGSALSDNARSVLHIARVGADTQGAPTNAGDLIAEGRLLRLSHVKSNYAAPAPDQYLERVVTPYAAQLVPFRAEFSKGDSSATWNRIADWLAVQTEVAYPTTTTVDTLGEKFGSRSERRRAIAWAQDRGLVREAPHPSPQGKRKTYLALEQVPTVDEKANAYRSTSRGE